MGCIGAPIFEQEESVTGVISISRALYQVLGAGIEGLAEEPLKTSAEISQYMGHLIALWRHNDLIVFR